MEIHLSAGVSTLVALMAAHRAGSQRTVSEIASAAANDAGLCQAQDAASPMNADQPR